MFLRWKRFLLCFLPSTALLLAQSETATLRGTVTDTAGTPLKNITLVVTSADTNVAVREVNTDNDGQYEAPYLRPGPYQVKIDQNGYQLYEADGILLDPGQIRRFDPKLVAETSAAPAPPAGQEANPVTVHESASLIQSESGTVSNPIDFRARWNDAPVVDLHPSMLPLLTTVPAVQGNGTGLVISGVSSRNQQTWAVDGVPQDTVSQTGNPNFFNTVEMTIANPGVDASRPVNFNMVSRHGGDALHGQVYVKRGSSAFSARPYFNTQNPNYKFTELEGQLGGPIISNWTYFFAGASYQKNPYHQTLYADVPTAQMRLLDLSQYLNPQTAPNGKVVVVRDPRTGVPFPNNQIPGSRLNGVASKYLTTYYPAANTGDANRFNQNYSWDHPFAPDSYVGNWPFGRIDQKLWSQNQLYFRWMQNQTASVAPGSIGEQLDSTQSARYRTLAVSDVDAFTSTLVNRFTVGHSGYQVKQGESEGNITPLTGDSVVSTLGLQGVNPSSFSTMGFPTLSIAGLTGLSMAYAGGKDKSIAQNDNTTSVEDSVTWSHGRHSFKAGVQYFHYDWTQGAIPQSVYGSFDFSGAFTGLAYADFLLGLPATSTRSTVRPNRVIHQNQTGAYLADSFRVTSRLTLNYGVRWDYYGTPVYDDGYMSNFDPSGGGTVLVAPGTLTSVSEYYPASIVVKVGRVAPKAKTTNFRPHVSAAYQLGENMVLRGGYAEYTENPGYGADGALNPTDPFQLTETYTNSITGSHAAISFPNPFPATPSSSLLPSQTVTALPAKTDEGVIRQYNATIERATHGLGLRLSYIGARGSGMNYSLNIDKPHASATPFTTSKNPYPQFAAVNTIRNDGQWHYDSAVVEARKRAGSVTFDTSFTWANNLANYLNTTDPYNVTNQWTRDGADRRMYFVGSAAWPLPVGKGRRFLSQASPMMDRVLGHWTLYAIATFASGQYYSPLFTGPDPANASAGYVTQLPDCVGDPNAGARTLNQWFNPAAFAVPPANAGRYGTCGMNILEGYPIHVGHVSLAKQIPFGERLRAVFTVQASDVTNTPHFTIPNNNISNPNPGVFTAASVVENSPERQGYRQVDFKLRLEW